jgi:hypothetical protein
MIEEQRKSEAECNTADRGNHRTQCAEIDSKREHHAEFKTGYCRLGNKAQCKSDRTVQSRNNHRNHIGTSYRLRPILRALIHGKYLFKNGTMFLDGEFAIPSNLISSYFSPIVNPSSLVRISPSTYLFQEVTFTLKIEPAIPKL